MNLLIPISPGELLDKLSILEIKAERIDDLEKSANIQREQALLEDAWDGSGLDSEEIRALQADLKLVNEALWDIEDAIRLCEKTGNFGDRFIELARSVYITNDRRAALKKDINKALGSVIVEEKSYQDYRGAP